MSTNEVFANYEGYLSILESDEAAANVKKIAAERLGRQLSYDLYTIATYPKEAALAGLLSNITSKPTTIRGIINPILKFMEEEGIRPLNSIRANEYRPTAGGRRVIQEFMGALSNLLPAVREIGAEGVRLGPWSIDMLMSYRAELRGVYSWLERKVGREAVEDYKAMMGLIEERETGGGRSWNRAKEERLAAIERRLREAGVFDAVDEAWVRLDRIKADYRDAAAVISLLEPPFGSNIFHDLSGEIHAASRLLNELRRAREISQSFITGLYDEFSIMLSDFGVKDWAENPIDVPTVAESYRREIEEAEGRLRSIATSLGIPEEEANRVVSSDLVNLAEIKEGQRIAKRRTGFRLGAPEVELEDMRGGRQRRRVYVPLIATPPGEAGELGREELAPRREGDVVIQRVTPWQARGILEERGLVEHIDRLGARFAVEEALGESSAIDRGTLAQYRRDLETLWSVQRRIAREAAVEESPYEELREELAAVGDQYTAEARALGEELEGIKSLEELVAGSEEDMPEAGGLEAARAAISKEAEAAGAFDTEVYRDGRMAKISKRLRQEDIERNKEAWREAYRNRERVLLRGSAVPFVITNIDEKTGQATLRTYTRPASEITFVFRPRTGDAVTALQRVSMYERESRNFAEDLKTIAEANRLRERSTVVSAGGRLEAVRAGQVIEELLASSGKEAQDTLYDFAVRAVPWISRAVTGESARDNIINSSWLALHEALAANAVDASSLTVDKFLTSPRLRVAYAVSLLDRIYAEKSRNEYNAVATLFDWARKTLREATLGAAPGTGYTDKEVAELVISGVKSLIGRGDDTPGIGHLRYIARMTPEQVIREVRNNAEVREISLDAAMERRMRLEDAQSADIQRDVMENMDEETRLFDVVMTERSIESSGEELGRVERRAGRIRRVVENRIPQRVLYRRARDIRERLLEVENRIWALDREINELERQRSRAESIYRAAVRALNKRRRGGTVAESTIDSIRAQIERREQEIQQIDSRRNEIRAEADRLRQQHEELMARSTYAEISTRDIRRIMRERGASTASPVSLSELLMAIIEDKGTDKVRITNGALRYIARNLGRMLIDVESGFEGMDEGDAYRHLQNLINLRKALSKSLEMETYVAINGQRMPVMLYQGNNEIIAVNQVTNERWAIGPGTTFTASMADSLTTLESKMRSTWEYRTVAPVEAGGINAPAMFHEAAGGVIVRDLGVGFRDLLPSAASRAGTHVIPGYFATALPDITIASFHTLRGLEPGQYAYLAGFDWETTTLLEQHGERTPFHPTEVGFRMEKLTRTESGFTRSEVLTRHIIFKPSREVRRAVTSIIRDINESIKAASATASVPIREGEFQFLKNIARFGDPSIADMGPAVREGTVELTAGEANRLIEATRSGLKYLSAHGRTFKRGLESLAGAMERATAANAFIFGQNLEKAELMWNMYFAEKAGKTPTGARFREATERFFSRPHIELMVLDRLMRTGRPGGTEGGSSMDVQFQRWLQPVIRRGRRESLRYGAGEMVRDLVTESAYTHRGASDIAAELGVLYSHLGREAPEGVYQGPLQAGDYVMRVYSPRVTGAFASAEEGRPVRGVFRYAGITREGDIYAMELEELRLDEAGRPAATGRTSRLYAPNLVELSRRFHEAFEYLPDEEAAAKSLQELREDYARREIAKAKRSPGRLSELMLWGRYGLPSASAEGGPAPVERIAGVLQEAAQKVSKGQPLTPAEELLFGSTIPPGRDTSAPAIYDITRTEAILSEVAGYRATEARTESFPLVREWLESPEGRAYATILQMTRRYHALGILGTTEAETMRQVDQYRRQFLSEMGITPPTAERRGLYSIGVITAGDYRSPEFKIRATSIYGVQSRLDGIVRKVAADMVRGMENQGPDINAATRIVMDHLRRQGYISRSAQTVVEAAGELYRSARSGRIPLARVELEHLPAITDDRTAWLFTRKAIENVLIPSLSIDLQEGASIWSVEQAIADNPLLNARDMIYMEAQEELAGQGMELMDLHPVLRPGVITIDNLDLPDEAARAEIDYARAYQEAADLVNTLKDASDRLRRDRGFVYKKALDENYHEQLEELRRRIMDEMEEEVRPTWDALGWGEGRPLERAIIPVFSPHGTMDIFMREIGDLDEDALMRVKNLLDYRGGAVNSRIVGGIERYLTGRRRDGAPGAEAVRTINEATTEAAAEGVQGSSTVSEQTRQLNESIINEANRRAGDQAGERTGSQARGRRPGYGNILDEVVLGGKWKLLAGAGLALGAVAMALRHRDHEEYSSDTGSSYRKASKPMALRPMGENEPVYNRPAPVDDIESRGIRIGIKGRRRGKISGDDLSGAVNQVLNQHLGPSASVNIRMQDDTRTINEQYASEVFAQLLKYGYAK